MFIYKKIPNVKYSLSQKHKIVKNTVIAIEKSCFERLASFIEENKDKIEFKKNCIQELHNARFFINKELFVLNTLYNSGQQTFHISSFGDKELLQDFYDKNLKKLHNKYKENNQKPQIKITGDESSIEKIIQCSKRYYDNYQNIKEAHDFVFDNDKISWYKNNDGTWSCDFSFYDEKYVQELKYILKQYNMNVKLEEITLQNGTPVAEIFSGLKDALLEKKENVLDMSNEEIAEELIEFSKEYYNQKKQEIRETEENIIRRHRKKKKEEEGYSIEMM